MINYYFIAELDKDNEIVGAVHAVVNVIINNVNINVIPCGSFDKLESYYKITIKSDALNNWLKWKGGSIPNFTHKKENFNIEKMHKTINFSKKDVNDLLAEEQRINLKLELAFLADMYGEEICGSCSGFEN